MSTQTKPEVRSPEERFLDGLSVKAQNTQRVYLRYWGYFLKDTGHTPDSFYEYMRENLMDENPEKIDEVKRFFTKYFDSLITERGYHINTVKHFEKVILLFLETNYLKNKLPFRYRLSNGIKRQFEDSFKVGGKDKAEQDEVKELLQYQSEPRNISAILFLRDSGLRVSDIVELKIKHIKPILDDPSLEWYSFEIIPTKNLSQTQPLPANPVIGKEAIEALRKWLKYREQKYGLDNSDLEGYVYCSVYNKRNTKVGDKLTPHAITQVFRLTRNKANMDKEISPHSLRKMHTTNLTGAGVPERWINVMQGKKGSGTQGSYQRPNSKELIEVYKKAYSSISLEKETVSKEEIDNLEQRLEEQQKAINALMNMRIGKAKDEAITLDFDSSENLHELYKLLPKKKKEPKITEDYLDKLLENPEFKKLLAKKLLGKGF